MKRLLGLFKCPEIWVLTAVALITRLWQIGWPQTIVFDEVYFREFASNYLTGKFFFDIHPPLVKLIFAAIGSIAHLQPLQVVAGYPGDVILRTLPALAGAALVPLIYIIIRQLGLGRRIATFGGLMVLFDNALLVESRFVLMDSILLLAGMGALSCYLQLRKSIGRRRWMWLIATALLLGILVSIKWTGLAMAGLIALIWLVDGVLRHLNWKKMLSEVVVVLIIIMTIYVGSFAVHFALLNRSGEGDAFMSEKFQSTLIGNSHYKSSATMSFFDKFTELNTEMYTAQSSLNGVQHPYASRWYSWPLEIRSVYFWQGQTQSNGQQGNIYLLGNPAVWWLSAVGVVTLLAIWLVKPKWLGRHRKLAAFILTGYALNFVPFTFINRPMFLYHYLFALVFSILATCVLLALLFDWQNQKFGKKVVNWTYWMLVVIVVLGFLYFLPLSYGIPMSTSDLQQHMWLPTWR